MLQKAMLFLLSVSALCSLSSYAPAYYFDNFYVIGDSLSDEGNTKAFGGLFPPKDQAPLTNPGGHTYSFYFYQYFGHLPPDGQIANLPAGGTNFAIVGSSTGENIGTFIFNGGFQIEIELGLTPGLDLSHSLIIHWLGANDIILSRDLDTKGYFPGCFASLACPATSFDAKVSVDNVINNLNSLRRLGANYILVMNVPGLDKVPDAINHGAPPPGEPTLAEFWKKQSEDFNTLLIDEINKLDYHVIHVDIYSVLNFIIANASRYGFDNITDGCDTSGIACSKSLFWNEVHPTDKTHRMLADFLIATITAPDFVGTFSNNAIGTLQNHYRNLSNQYPILHRRAQSSESRLIPFFHADYSYQKNPGAITQVNDFGQHGPSALAGAAIPLDSHHSTLVGGAVHSSYNWNHFDSFNSKYESIGVFASLFMSVDSSDKRWFGNGALSYGYLNLPDIHRRFKLGVDGMGNDMVETVKGSTHGHQFGANVQGGYRIPINQNLNTGPIASMEFQHVRINGYNETDHDPALMFEFGAQNNNIFLTSLGWQIEHESTLGKTTKWTNRVSAMARHQWLRDHHLVSFRSQSQFSPKATPFPVSKPSLTLASFEVGSTLALTETISLLLNYQINIASELTQHAINGGITMTL